MRKRIIGTAGAADQSPVPEWLDLETLAEVELTSEDPAHPFEAALRATGSGWRAETPGRQIIRLFFSQPQSIRRIRLVFREAVYQRTQEFVLRWSADGGRSFTDIVRQQYNFSPPGAGEEVEEYQVELAGVTVLALEMIPDTSGRPLHAALAALQVG